MAATTVLVVDSELENQELIATRLAHAGYSVRRALSAAAAEIAVRSELPDVLILEWTLPDKPGLCLIRHVRTTERTRDLPILVLTERSGEEDTVLALEAGADDYVTKPFSAMELVARVNAILRRGPMHRGEDVVEIAGLLMDPWSEHVSAGKRKLDLTKVQFRFLHFLMSHAGRVHSCAQLIKHVWGEEGVIAERSVAVHIKRLRRALQPSGHDGLIETVRGSGYMLRHRIE